MPRITSRRYQRRVMVAMAAYIACMLLAWPLAHTAASLSMKILLALMPVVPMLYVIGAMAQRIRDSDELEQRTHLVALGLATAVVGALSLVGGFLAAARLWRADGSILTWVFPAMLFCYGITRWWLSRRYGQGLSCDDESGVPLYVRFLLAAAALAALVWLNWRSLDAAGEGWLVGMPLAFALIGALLGMARWRRRQRRGDA